MNSMLFEKVTSKVFYLLPHDIRRHVYSKVYPSKFAKLQVDRDPHGASFLKSFDKHRCIFVHIPKTGGISVNKALFDHPGIGHKSIADYQFIFSRVEFNSYFKFTIVRNPWDRLYSAYHFLSKGGLIKADKDWAQSHLMSYRSFEDFVLHGLENRSILWWRHFRPQFTYFLSPGSKISPINFFGRFERLSDDYLQIKERLGAGGELNHENKTHYDLSKTDYREVYSSRMKSKVAFLYRNDIEYLGYKFSDGSN